MKKIILLITVMTGLVCNGYSQGTTSYGFNAGTGGLYNSFFGQNAGKNSTYHYNTAVGHDALETNVNGESNTALGFDALRRNQNGNSNTATGQGSMYTNISGDENTAYGCHSLQLNVSGNRNTAIGSLALFSNTGNYNTATGYKSMLYNGIGSYNTTSGYYALYTNSSGYYNTAIGSYAMYTNESGNNNTANGYRALYTNTGSHNTAIGSYCMNANVSGFYNTGIGHYTMANNTTGIRNSAEGFRALDNNTTGSYNTAEGAHALNYVSTGSYNSALGYDAGPTLVDLNNTTAIGYLAVPTASDQVRIGNLAVTSIGGQVEWTAFSDGRFKKDIKEDVSGLEFIKELRPVSYTVDKAGLNKFLQVIDSSSNQAEAKSVPVRQTGFVAQEVEAIVKKTGYVFSGVDAPENENDPYGIRYAAFVVPLVKAVQELSAKLEDEQKQNEEQRNQIQLLLAQLGSKIDRQDEAIGDTKAVLLPNNPNPFTADTEIKMTLPESVSQATIMIYTLEGKQMKNILVHNRGEVSVKILGNELSAGMYLYSLIADGKIVDTKRMILTR